MATTEQKKKLLKAKIAVALQDELGRVPKREEIEQVEHRHRGEVAPKTHLLAAQPG